VRRAWVILAIVATAVIGLAGPAVAHVEVQPAQAAAGQPASFAFRVPNEESTANTVSLVVRFPADHPVPDVVPTAPDGWTVETTNRTLPAPLTVGDTTVTEVVDTITWRGAMPPGRAEYFPVTTGPLPSDAGELVFDATQTYDNGVTAHWDELEVAGGPEPAHPAPVLLITGGGVPVATTLAGSAGHDHTTATTATTAGSVGGSSGGVVIAVVAAAVVAVAAVTVVLYRRVGR
jgi:periplasmic copper chaperone A